MLSSCTRGRSLRAHGSTTCSTSAAGKNYEVEAEDLHALIQTRRPGAASLLDVACGTGAHLFHMRRSYEVAGVDLAPAMLDEARNRLPDVPLIEGDMRSFALGRSFDAVTCLFSAIGYMQSTAELDEAVRNMRTHLAPGGVLVVDGWVRRQKWRDPGTVHVLSGHRDDLAVAASRCRGATACARRSSCITSSVPSIALNIASRSTG